MSSLSSPVNRRFILQRDYYIRINPVITITLVGSLWILFPILAFYPHALDGTIHEIYCEFIEENRHNLVKLFKVQVWVS